MLFPGEVESIKTVLALAEQYGYGNLISHLKRAWAVKLMEGNPLLDYERALLATNVDAYPEEFDIDAIAKELSR